MEDVNSDCAPTYFLPLKKNTTLKGNCCANSALRLKSITVNKQKLNNKHTHKEYKNLSGSTNCLPPPRRSKNFTIKIVKYNSSQKHSQEPQISITP